MPLQGRDMGSQTGPANRGVLNPAVAPEAKAPPAMNPKEAYKTKLKDYDKQIQANLDLATPEGKDTADRLTLAKSNFQKQNPYGSKGNHPGFLGKLGHVAAEIGNTAGNIVAPGVMAEIPGTEMNRAERNANTRAQINEDATDLAKTDKGAATPSWKEVTGGATDPQHPELGNQQAFFNEKDPTKRTYGGPVAAKEGAGSDQAKFLDQYYKDNPTAKKSAENDAKAIQQYKAAEATPATMMVPVAGQPGTSQAVQLKPGETYTDAMSKAGALQSQEAGVEKIFKGKTLIQTNPDGSRIPVTYEQAKANGFEGVVPLNAGQEEKERKKATSYAAATEGIDTYEKSLSGANLSDTDKKAMGVLIGSQDEHSDMVTGLVNAVTSALEGHPLTDYEKQVQNAVKTNDQYKNLSPEGRKILADYYSTMFLHFANVKDTQGGMPRNPRMIAYEIGNIPLPYLNKEEAAPGFTALKTRLAHDNRDNIPFDKPKEQGKTESDKSTEKKTEPPAVGFIKGGHKFLGGDPSKPESWDKVTAQ